MAETSQEVRHLGVRMIPLENLRSHPLNANVMPDDLRQKLKAHIGRTGRYPCLVVRPHPQVAGHFQVIDGHHRIGILRELGHTEARCDVWDVDDREARILLATLNRLEGQDQPFRRAELLHEILGEMTATDLASLLPEDEKQIEELHTLLEFPADEVAAELDRAAEEAAKTLPVVLNFVLTPEQARLVDEAIEAVSDGTPGRDRKARGLAGLARHYLESREQSIQQDA